MTLKYSLPFFGPFRLSGLLLLLAGVFMVSPAWTATGQTPAQETEAPVKIVKVGEAAVLTVFQASREGEPPTRELSPAYGHRFITLELQLAPSVDGFAGSNLIRVTPDNQAFVCDAMGGLGGAYCKVPGFILTRKGDSFVGGCIVSEGDRLDIKVFPLSVLVVAFEVPDSVPTDTIELVYTGDEERVPVHQRERTQLQNGLSVSISAFIEGDSASEPILSTAIMEVENNGPSSFRLHPGTVQLGFPGKPDDSGAITWSWRPPVGYAGGKIGTKMKSEIGPWPILSLAPGEKQQIMIAFRIAKEDIRGHCELGFFREYALPLANAEHAARK